jgi:hypothetical protein
MISSTDYLAQNEDTHNKANIATTRHRNTPEIFKQFWDNQNLATSVTDKTTNNNNQFCGVWKRKSLLLGVLAVMLQWWSIFEKGLDALR